MKSIFLVILAFFLVVAATAQSSYSRFAVGAGINANIYQGDLTKHRLGSIETAKPGFIVWGSYRFKENFTAVLSGSILTLKGDDSKYLYPTYRRERNFVFTGLISEVEAKVQYSLFKNNDKDYQLLFPYIGAGIGVGFYGILPNPTKLTPKLAAAEPWIVQGLVVDVARGPIKKQIYIPMQVGVKKYYSPRIDLYAEANYKWINTDYLDGFSQSAGSRNKDKYYAITVGAIYKFYKSTADKMGCPKW